MSICSSGSGAGGHAGHSGPVRTAVKNLRRSWAMTPTVQLHLQPAPGRLLDAGAQWSGRFFIMSISDVENVIRDIRGVGRG